MRRLGCILGLMLCPLVLAVALRGEAPKVYWPTPDARFFETGDILPLLQPTASGIPESALFGCVRNSGARFHEGLDLRPLRRDRSGEAADPIYAVMDGRVAHINTVAGNSSYGRYVVLEHVDADVPVYTLYAHLASVEAGLRVGTRVAGGQRLGTMGRSAGGYTIPRDRAHLHFEIGLLRTGRFDEWYARQDFGSPNRHGNFNGINLIGSNPLTFYKTVRAGEFQGFRSYFASLPTAFSLRVLSRNTPDFIHRYPGLLTRPIPREGVVGWDIDYTWYGLPKRWTPLTSNDIRTGLEGDLILIHADPSLFEGQCRQTLNFDREGNPAIGNRLRNDLRMMFGF